MADEWAAFRTPAQGSDEWAAFRAPDQQPAPAAPTDTTPIAQRSALDTWATPLTGDLMTGMAPQDVDPETVGAFGQGAREGAASAAASAAGALGKVPTAIDEYLLGGRMGQREITERMQESIRGLGKPAKKLSDLVVGEQPTSADKHPIASTVGGIAGGLPVGAAEWSLGWPMAVLSGLESAEEIAKQRGEKPSTWESWRDASLEALERVALGKVVDLPMGRITKGIIFGGGAGIQSEIEGRDRQSTAVSTVTNFLLGLLGPNITPGSKARLDAASEAAGAGDGPGGMHHLKEALTDPQVSGAIAEAARERKLEFPEPSGDALHQAAHHEAGPPQLEGPPDPGLPGPGGPQLRPPSDPGFRERQEGGPTALPGTGGPRPEYAKFSDEQLDNLIRMAQSHAPGMEANAADPRHPPETREHYAKQATAIYAAIQRYKQEQIARQNQQTLLGRPREDPELDLSEPRAPTDYEDSKHIGKNKAGEDVFERPNGNRVVRRSDGSTAVESPGLLQGREGSRYVRPDRYEVEEPAPRESVTPAVRSTTGEIFTGPTHAHAMEAAEEAGHEVAEEPGLGSFLTSTGRYVDRDEALLIQNKGVPLPAGAKPWEGRGEPPIVQFRKDAVAIEQRLPPVPAGMTRLWRGNRPGETGQNPQFTNDLAGIALPFRKQYGGDVSYVDVPTADLGKYEQKAGAATGAEFSVPPEIAARARGVSGELDFTRADPRAQGDPARQPGEALSREPPRPEVPRKGRASKPLRNHSLLEYISSRGGLKPTPDLVAIFGGKNPFIPGFGRLFRKKGLELDRAREAVVEARYLHDPGEASGGLAEVGTNDLLTAIAEEHAGRKQWRMGDEPTEKVRPQDAAERERDIHSAIDQAMEEIGLDPAQHLEPEVRARMFEMLDKGGETDALAAYEHAIMEEGHGFTETGEGQRINEPIPGWDDIHDDTGAAPQTGRSLSTIQKPQSLAPRATSRDVSQGDRATAGPGGPRLPPGGRGGGRFPGHEYGEWEYAHDPEQLEGPPPKGTFPEDRLPRMALDDPAAKRRAKDTLATVMTQRDRVNAMQRAHWDQGEDLFHGVPDEMRIRMMTNFMHGKDPLIGMDVKRAPPVAEGFTRYAMKGIYVDVPDGEATTLTRDFLREMLKARGRPLMRGAIGDNHSAQIREWFKKSGEIQDIQYQSERLGAEIDYEFRMNYWHLMWKDEAGAKASGAAFRGGRPDFTKHKTFEDPSMGIAAGLELKNTNPAVMAAARQEAGNMAIARVMAMRDLMTDGLAATESELRGGRRTAKMPHDVRDWKTLDVGGVRYRVHPEAHLMLERSLLESQKTIMEIIGLSPRSPLAKTERVIWSTLMKARNSTIPLKLAFSAFHAMHVLGIDAAQPIAAALHQKLNRQISNAEFLRAIRDHKMLEAYAYGSKAAENWPKPFEELSPIQQVEQNLMIAGGYTPGKPSIYEIGATRALRRQLNDVLPSLQQKLDKDGAGIVARLLKTTPEHAKAVSMLIGRGIEHIQGPLFDDWIPAIKTAAYLNQAKLLVTARPELLAGGLEASAALRRELQTIRRSIDNRFGEMQYDKEFMPQFARRIFMGSMLSVGWNFGFLREFGGGLLVDPASNIYRGAQNLFRSEKIHNEISTRTVYAGIYIGMAMAITGLMSYLFTGEKPDDMRDFVYPKHADGTRSTTMWFTREFTGAYFHMLNEGVLEGSENLAASKLNPILQSFYQVLHNRDYFGHQIWDANAPTFRQLEQAGAFLGKNVFEPISFSGLEQSSTADDPARVAQSFLGFNPAPAYVERSPTVSAIYKASSDLLGGKTAYDKVEEANMKRDMAHAFRKVQASHDPKDQENYMALRDKYVQQFPQSLGVNAKNLKQSERNWARPPALGTFARIGTVSPETQARIFDQAPLSEKAWLQAGLLKRLREGRAFEVTPEMVATFPEVDQDNVMKIIGVGQRDAYLPYLTPKLQKQYGARTGLLVTPEGKGEEFPIEAPE